MAKFTDKDPLMVSIRCITYNHEKYIRDALEGFVMQKTNFRFEAVVHDDASTDGTAAIIREYEEKYPDIIKPIYETENQHSKHDGSIRRIMNAACTGKYIAFCEGDDYWTDPLKLQKQVDFLENNPEYSMCFHKAKIENEYDIRCAIWVDLIEDRDFTAMELFSHWIVPTASMVYCREKLDYQTHGDNRILNGDLIYVLKSAQTGKVRAMSDVMSVYRMQPSGVTYDEKYKRYRAIKYPDHYLFILDNFPILNRNKVKRSVALSFINRIHYQESFSGKVSDLCKALYYSPFFTTKVMTKIILKKTLSL